MEIITKENGFVFFPNHQGLYDVLAVLESCPVPFAFVIKKEARNVILLKQVVDALGSISIDREDIRQSMQVIQQVAEEVKRHFPGKVYAAVIPRNVRLSEAPSYGKPVSAYDSLSRGGGG